LPTTFAHSQTVIPGGSVSGTWTASGSPYLIEGEIVINNRQTLTIESGVEVIFQGHYKLIVNGWLQAIGAESDSILFTAADTTVGWHGIRFIEAADTSHLSYCIIQYGRVTGIWQDGYGGAIYMFISNPKIDHSTISRNTAELGGGIYFDMSNPTFDHCLIVENSATSGGGMYANDYYGWVEDLTITNCTISRNSAIQDGGAIYCTFVDDFEMTNTIIEGNAGNTGVFLEVIGFPNVTFGDYFNNEGNFVGYLGYGFGILDTINANGDSCDQYFNIFMDPMFVDPEHGDFHLQDESPCIDAGNPENPRDPDGTITDIGVHFYHQIVPVIDLSTTLLDFGAIPVGNQAERNLTIYNLGEATLVIYDISTTDPAFSTNFTPASSQIPAHDSLIVTVFFTPLDSSDYEENLSIDNNDIYTEVELFGVGLGEGTYLSGSLSGVLEAATYIVTDDIFVNEGDSLVINPGAEFYFTDAPGVTYSFIVEGYLGAIGTQEDSIKFLPYEGVENWGGIDFLSPYNVSNLEYCVITRSNSSGVSCDNSNPTVQHCTIYDCWGCGIFCQNSSQPTIQYCKIAENSWSGAGGILVQSSSNPIIEYCEITGNTVQVNHGGGINISEYLSGATIRYCIIKHNSAGAIGGGVIFTGNTIIESCKIDSNIAGVWGGAIYGVDEGMIRYCSFVGNSAGEIGGAVLCYGGQPWFINCTFSGNLAPQGGAIGLNPWNGFDPNPILTNCILWNNGDREIYLGASYNVSATYSDISGGWPGIGNINEDPLFYATSGDSAYYLTLNSPCIDAGDPNSPLDPDSTRADMGAYYFAQGPTMPRPEMVLSANFLGFGAVLTGTQFSLPFTIYNDGNANLVLFSISSTDSAFSTDFDPADSLIAPGDSVSINVIFSPIELIEYSGILTIENNDEQAEVGMIGYGINSCISVSTDLLDFGTVTVGQQTVRSLTIYNWGNINLVIFDIQSSDTAVFSTDYDPADSLITPDGSLYVTVTFTPADTIEYEEVLSIENSDQLVEVDLVGTGRAPVGINGEDDQELPEEFALHPSYPCPFNPIAKIRYDLPVACAIRLAVFDISGRKVKDLVDNWQKAGYHEIEFDGTQFASGIYFYKFQAGNFTASGKMVLIK